MRGQLTRKIVAAMAVGFVGVTAFAQTDAGGDTAAASDTATTSPANPGAQQAQPPNVSTVAPTTGNPGTSTASLSDAAKQVKKRKVKGEVYNYNYIGADQLNHGEGQLLSKNYLGVKYAINDTRSASIRQTFNFKWPKSYNQGKATIEDIYLNYTDTKLATFAGEGTLTGIFRAYLPTGESSRYVTKRRGAALAWFIASYPVGKIDLNYHAIGYYFNQSQESYVDAEGAEQPNADFELVQFPEVNWNISDKLSWATSVGTDTTLFRPVPVKGTTRQEVMALSSTVTWQPDPLIGVTVGFENDVNIWDASRDFALFRDDEMTYIFLLTSSI